MRTPHPVLAAAPQLLVPQGPATYYGEPSHILLGAAGSQSLPGLGSHGALCKLDHKAFFPQTRLVIHLLCKYF